VVYDTLKFAPGSSSRDRQNVVDARRDKHIAALRRIIAALDTQAERDALSAEDKRILALWGPNPSAIILKEATQRVRFQLGQADRFKEGLIRSSQWETHIAETFANQGLPPELAVLPHVESSFNAAAYSKVGAAGMWQFMRSTGRRYMRVDDAVDERLDPYRSTEAAAQLLAYNYRVLNSWPLALTAYNHGAAGMRRAKESVGTDDFVKINRTYNSRTFGFASRNFFPSFLAALTIDENPEKYFGPLDRRPEQKFHEVTMPAYVRLATLERVIGVDREQLRVLNPGWRPTIYNGTRLVPKGYRLRLPADTAGTWTADALLSWRRCRAASCTQARWWCARTACARENRWRRSPSDTG
jgi:membrane-bound lytic murein transglycosylase D